MAERNVSVKVRADVADFKRGMDEAGRSAEQLGTKAEQAGQKSKTGLSGMAQHVRDNRDAWSTTGGALTAYGLAVTGVAGLVGKVGIEYNTLRQTSTAALTSLTGSAEDANAQMAKLDEFATTSPFARDVFIRAQQQMLGFGIEAEKVIPYLDSIQNAVAATGGSNQDISELSRIFSQISASAKITAEDLNMFGTRGIDAATLIGSQMGKTGAEIRESITEGTLDAGEALDALAAAMDTRFEGAADNVKNTMLGAVDRVKAAFRDLSSSAMSIFVDPDGGGLAVDGLNKLADALRAFESMPSGLRNSVLAIGGMSGVVALLGGAAMLAVPRLVDLYDAFGRMGRAGDIAQTSMRGVGRAIGPASALVAGLVAIPTLLNAVRDAYNETIPGVEGVGAALLDVSETGSVASLDAQIEGLQIRANGLSGMAEGPISDLQGAFSRLADPTLTQKMEGLDKAVSFGLMRTSKDDVLDYFASVDGYLTQLVQGGNAEQATQLLGDLWDAASGAGMDRAEFDALFAGTLESLQGLENEARLAAQSTEGLIDVMRTAPEHLALMREGADALSGSIQEAADKFINLSENINDSEVSLDKWLDGIIEQANARDQWAQNMETLLSEGLDMALYAALIEQGPNGALRVQQMVDDLAAGRDVSEFNVLGERMGSEVVDGAANAIAESQFPVVEFETKLDRVNLHREVLGLNRELEELPPATLNMDVDASAAYLEANLWTDTANEMWGTANLDADPIRAMVQIQEWNALAGRTVGMPMLDADPAQAQKQLNDWQRLATGTTGVPLIDANPSLAQSVLAAWKWRADNTEGVATLTAIDYATGVLNAFLNRIPRSVSIGIAASPLPGAGLIGGLLGGMGRADGGPINRASGGPVYGPGGPRDDLVSAYNVQSGQPYRLSNNEHIWTAAETAAVGGHEEMYRLRKAALSGAVRFDIGGHVAASYASRAQVRPAQGGAVTAVLAPEDRARIDAMAALANRPVDVSVGAETVFKAGRQGSTRYGDRPSWGQGPQPGRTR